MAIVVGKLSIKPMKMMCVYMFICRLRKLVKKHNLVVASYDVVRNDIDFFRYDQMTALCSIVVFI